MKQGRVYSMAWSLFKPYYKLTQQPKGVSVLLLCLVFGFALAFAPVVFVNFRFAQFCLARWACLFPWYIKKRSSSKIQFIIDSEEKRIYIPISKTLFEWVIENLCKNAIDSIGGAGTIHIELYNKVNEVIIDVSDTGKGIPRSKFKTIFKPGFTTKKRGWGLGLTLAKRIIEEYHKGKIFVKQSEPEVKTTFRIVLRKK